MSSVREPDWFRIVAATGFPYDSRVGDGRAIAADPGGNAGSCGKLAENGAVCGETAHNPPKYPLSTTEHWRREVPSEEQALVDRCLAGEESAYFEFVESYQSLVFGVCLRMLGDRHEAEDASQDVFVRALKSLKSWDPLRPLRPWLLTIAANRCRTYLHLRKRRPTASEYMEDVADPRAAQDDGKELWSEIRKVLDELRPDYRRVFLLFHEQGLSYEEMSQLTGKPIGTLKTWLHRGRNEMLRLLREKGLATEVSNDAK